MTVKSIKKWFWVHRWTSLVCTLFLLLLCTTGLPLIFGEELEHVFSNEAPYDPVLKGAPAANMDDMVKVAHSKYPKDVIAFIFVDDDEPQVVVHMRPGHKARNEEDHALTFDAHSGRLRKDEPPRNKQTPTFLTTMFSLHRDLFMDLPGELFLGFMGLLFVFAIISGIVLYGPFMKKLDFGTIRAGRSKRLKWLDLHNLLGIATGVWLLVVGLTGVFNELSTPLFGIWQMTDVKQMLHRYEGKPTVKDTELSSVQHAFTAVQQTLPGMEATSIVYPGNAFGSPYHYLIWTKGKTAVTSRLFSPVLVDARTGQTDVIVKMPWYLRSLELSRPLHFGDYGGMPLKILWAIFDLIAIIVLLSGVYLWLTRQKKYKAYFTTLKEDTVHETVA
ncbi:PepSY-associated TM helix domain-containing protein [Taibaiella soli]|uniref:PepSY domain-containing protein n=1 Tax=Taibaiella soli TaxID=1649169 RepID=A0A2W2A6S7_9BACT|nr:PepSY-associated TM helix domain-containing protein [Taibaiella soli]PZF70995.1 PepSY domain-containing protein [Taibaiella soli]